MKAIRIDAFGGAEALRLQDVPEPVPESGEIVVRVEAAGVNFIDVYHRTGLYPNPLPLVPGLEGAGVVTALGPQAAGFRVGDRVAWTSALGSYAECVRLPAQKAVAVPAAIDSRTAAALMLQGMTAQYLCRQHLPAREGPRLPGPRGRGRGRAAARADGEGRGARVIGTVSTEAKAALAREAGADEVILYTQEDFVAAVKRLTDGRGVDVVYDGVGKDTAVKGLDCLAPARDDGASTATPAGRSARSTRCCCRRRGRSS